METPSKEKVDVEIELVPALAPEDPAFLAAEAAITQSGLADDARPPGNTSAWWRAGVYEAVEPRVAARDHVAAAGRTKAGTHRPGASSPEGPLSV
jgi:hypothetical protein